MGLGVFVSFCGFVFVVCVFLPAISQINEIKYFLKQIVDEEKKKKSSA